MEGIPSWSMPWLCSKQNMDDLEQTHLFLWNLGMAMVRIMRLQSKTSCTILLNYGLNTDCIYNIHISSHRLFLFFGGINHLMQQSWTDPLFRWTQFTHETLNQLADEWTDVCCSLPINSKPSFSLWDTPFSNMKKNTLGISYCLAVAFHQVCQKALQARVVSAKPYG